MRQGESDQGIQADFRAEEFEAATLLAAGRRDHADHHMSVLLSIDGPFKGCNPDDGHRSKLAPLPWDDPPEGLF